MSASELDRIRRVYESYDRDPSRAGRMDPSSRANRAIIAERWRAIERLLQQSGKGPLAGERVLEIGCGSGANVAPLVTLGADPTSLLGVDLSAERLGRLRRTHRQVPVALADGCRLPFPPEVFGAVVLFTVISSILDRAHGRALARDAVRVLAPGGVLIWYDLRYRNPQNPNVRGIDRRELKVLFPALTPHVARVTLVPPVARRLGRATTRLYPILAALPGACSHYAAVLRKPL